MLAVAGESPAGVAAPLIFIILELSLFELKKPEKPEKMPIL